MSTALPSVSATVLDPPCYEDAVREDERRLRELVAGLSSKRGAK